MHFIIHLPTIVRKNGHMRSFWTMNYERLNGKIKASSHIINNFRNPQLTLAFRRLCDILSKKFDSNYCKDYVNIQSPWEMFAADFLTVDIASHFNLLDDHLINVSDCVNVNGALFKIKSLVIVDNKANYDYTFRKIISIVFIDENIPILVAKDYVTEFFDNHAYVHEIKHCVPSSSRLLKIEDLLDYRPLESLEKGRRETIRLKYGVLKNVSFFWHFFVCPML